MKTSNMYNLKGEFLEHYLETQVDQNLSALQRGHLVAVTQFLMGKLNFCDFIFELQRQLDLKDKAYVTFIHKNLISKESLRHSIF